MKKMLSFITALALVISLLYTGAYVLKAGTSVRIASGDATGDLKWTTANMWNNSSYDPAQLYDAAGNLVSSFGR